MKSSVVVAGIVSFVLANSTGLSAQLGTIAKKEAERRKTAKQGKTYTNDNLPAVPPPASAPASSGAQSSDASAPPAAAPAPSVPSSDAAAPPPPRVSADPAERKKEEATWRERIKGEREALDRAKTFADALQTKINSLNADFVNRDDPAQRAVISADRDKSLAELDRLKKEIAEHTKAIAGIQEEARRAGVPAGWVR